MAFIAGFGIELGACFATLGAGLLVCDGVFIGPKLISTTITIGKTTNSSTTHLKTLLSKDIRI